MSSFQRPAVPPEDRALGAFEERLLTELKMAVAQRASALPSPAQPHLNEVPVPSLSGRSRVRAPRGGIRLPHLRGRVAVAAALTVAVAAGLAIRLVAGGASPGSRNGTLTVTELAYRTASAAATQPDVSPGQWVYRSLVEKEPSLLLPPAGRSVAKGTTVEQWNRADDTLGGYVINGKLEVGPWSLPFTLPSGKVMKDPLPKLDVRYAELGSLPSNPAALVTYLSYIRGSVQQQGSLAPKYRAYVAFDVISEMLINYVMPPQLTAEMYRALADIPGITVDNNAVDLGGQHGVGFFSATVTSPGTPAEGGLELIINPSTYQAIGFQAQAYRHASGDWATVGEGSAILRHAFVSGPGVRP